MKKFKRRANGEGSIQHLKGNRRKPYTIRVTVGYDINGVQKIKYLGYYETMQQAKEALNMYNLMRTNNNARHLNEKLYDELAINMPNEVSFREVFDQVLLEDTKMSEERKKVLRSTFNHLEPIANMPVSIIKLNDMQKCIDEAKAKGLRYGTTSAIKIICTKVFNYAVIHEYIGREKDYTSYLNVYTSQPRKTVHKAISREILRNIANSNDIIDKMIIVYSLTGCRPNELYHLDRDKIFENYLITGSKTEAGKNRKVPIHPLIKDKLIEVLDYVDSFSSLEAMTAKFRRYNKYDLTLYDCRHTFATLARESGLEETAIKKIMGHKTNDLTNDIYTHESVSYLYTNIIKIHL